MSTNDISKRMADAMSQISAGKEEITFSLSPQEQEIAEGLLSQFGGNAIIRLLAAMVFDSVCKENISENLLFQIIRYFVSQGADVNARDDKGQVYPGSDYRYHVGYTPLHYAVERNIELVRFLVTQGASVNAKNDNGTTPLYYAVASGNIEIIKFLVSQGAEVIGNGRQ